MSKKDKKDLVHVVSFFMLILIAVLIRVAFYEKTHLEFDEKISGKEATVVSEVATIHYDEPLGRNTDTIPVSQKVILTGKMAHFLQNDTPMLEIRLENDSLAWISKKDIDISE